MVYIYIYIDIFYTALRNLVSLTYQATGAIPDPRWPFQQDGGEEMEAG